MQDFRNARFCEVVTPSFGFESLSIPMDSLRAERQISTAVDFSHLKSKASAKYNGNKNPVGPDSLCTHVRTTQNGGQFSLNTLTSTVPPLVSNAVDIQ